MEISMMQASNGCILSVALWAER